VYNQDPEFLVQILPQSPILSDNNQLKNTERQPNLYSWFSPKSYTLDNETQQYVRRNTDILDQILLKVLYFLTKNHYSI
jgi:hypothetical protein